MILEEVKKIIEMSWSKDTCVPSLKEQWNEENKALGQCAITALIVNDFLGGKIMRCMTESGSHYYNLVNQRVIDLTVSQFDIKPDYRKSELRTREYLLSNEDTKNRYIELLERVKENFIQYGSKEYKLTSINGEYFSKIPGTCGGNRQLKTYGRIDCPSAIKYEEYDCTEDNTVFFESSNHAEQLGYRPCIVCMKKEYQIWDKKNIKTK